MPGKPTKERLAIRQIFEIYGVKTKTDEVIAYAATERFGNLDLEKDKNKWRVIISAERCKQRMSKKNKKPAKRKVKAPPTETKVKIPKVPADAEPIEELPNTVPELLEEISLLESQIANFQEDLIAAKDKLRLTLLKHCHEAEKAGVDLTDKSNFNPNPDPVPL